MIARLDSGVVKELREALPRFAHVPLAHLHHLKSDQRLNYWLDEITHSLADSMKSPTAWRMKIRSGLGLWPRAP